MHTFGLWVLWAGGCCVRRRLPVSLGGRWWRGGLWLVRHGDCSWGGKGAVGNHTRAVSGGVPLPLLGASSALGRGCCVVALCLWVL